MEKQEDLCASTNDIATMINLGEEFVEAVGKSVRQAKARGENTDKIEKLLADASKRLRANRRKLRL